ncbi:hypothetical protein OUZ56_012532 [Daphnia magna]|uniref:Uncharacterized protein n=1 Tax=Daphnia magna TaxID=35525 RepID=A0ABQ9Z4H4_9CRUS|nr:hypothetical protein OUZ56_012532 [Daphnia magna]
MWKGKSFRQVNGDDDQPEKDRSRSISICIRGITGRKECCAICASNEIDEIETIDCRNADFQKTTISHQGGLYVGVVNFDIRLRARR